MKKIVNNMNSIFNKVLNLKRFKDKKKKFALQTLLSFRIGTQEWNLKYLAKEILNNKRDQVLIYL